MNSAGNIFASGNLTAGTIKSNGTIESAGRVKVGEYLHLSGTLKAQYDDQRCSGTKNDHCYSNFSRLYVCK